MSNFPSAILKKKKKAENIETDFPKSEFKDTIDSVPKEKLNTVDKVPAKNFGGAKKVDKESSMSIDLLLNSAKKKPTTVMEGDAALGITDVNGKKSGEESEKYKNSLKKFKKR